MKGLHTAVDHTFLNIILEVATETREEKTLKLHRQTYLSVHYLVGNAAGCLDLHDEKIMQMLHGISTICISSHVRGGYNYVKRRLNTYNFTIYNLGNADGNAYIWNESIASRGPMKLPHVYMIS